MAKKPPKLSIVGSSPASNAAPSTLGVVGRKLWRTINADFGNGACKDYFWVRTGRFMRQS